MKDYYKILNVAHEPSSEELKVAYKTALETYDPTRFHVSNKARMVSLSETIHEAYQTLSDPGLKHQYDQRFHLYQEQWVVRQQKQRRIQGLKRFFYGFCLAAFLVIILQAAYKAFELLGVRISSFF